MTKDEIQRLRELHAEAEDYYPRLLSWEGHAGVQADDAAFYRAAHAALPALLDEVERWRAARSEPTFACGKCGLAGEFYNSWDMCESCGNELAVCTAVCRALRAENTQLETKNRAVVREWNIMSEETATLRAENERLREALEAADIRTDA